MTSLLDLMREPPTRRQVDVAGEVLQTDPDETIILPHPRLAWDRVRIELHHFDSGWTWSTEVTTNLGGWGYRVGSKWGQFAKTRDDALYFAAREIIERLERRTNLGPDAALIIKWAKGV